MSYSAGLAAWKIAFQASPIVLTNGLFNSFPGKMFPIMAITEALNLPLGALSSPSNIGLDSFFANYQPMPGSTLVDQQIAAYPFANAQVAANSVIAQPLQISMLMVCPVQNAFGYWERLAVIMALKAVLDRHNQAGGTYIVATPSYIYTNCVMLSMRDASTALTKQPQNAWQLDFIRPLITLDDAQEAQNGLFSSISAGLEIGVPAFSGLGAAASTVASLASVGITPIASGAISAGTSAASSLAAGIAPL
jgi:hypothetical protein